MSERHVDPRTRAVPASSGPHPQKPLGKRLLRLAIWIAVFLFVFGWLLPQFIDYDEVWNAIKGLSAWQAVVLLALGLVRVPTEAIMFRALLPGFSLWRGTEAYFSSNLAAQVVPPPGAEVVKYAYFRGAGYDAGASGLAALGSFLFPTLGRLALPLVAFVLLLATGRIDGETVLLGAISLIVIVAGGLVGYFLLRSERSARWLGARLQRPISWVLVKLKREPLEDAAERAARLRVDALAVLRQGWLLGSVGVALNLLLTFLILLAAVRFVGVSQDELPTVEVFAAFALAFWAGAVIPITGSGLGVVDAVLIGSLATQTSASNSSLVAAALLWRVFYSFITLPFGAITLSRFRKANPDLLRRKRDGATEDAGEATRHESR
jgi:uncharacterized membrane protein YbhN (UPF0104 family)